MAVTEPEGIIADLLFERVSTIPGDYKTVYGTGSSGNLPTSGSYIIANILPNGFSYEGLKDGRLFRGLMQVTLVQIKPPSDVQTFNTAGIIASHFAKNTRLFGNGLNVKLTNNPSIGQPYPDDADKTRTPITIQYSATETSL